MRPQLRLSGLRSEISEEPSDLVSEMITVLSRRTTAQFAEMLAPLGVTPAQFAVLDYLFARGMATQTDIARAVAVEQPTMAATLRRMERDGLVVRIADPSDGRQTFVSPSSSMKRKRARLTAARQRLEEVVLGQLPGTDRDELKRILTSLQEMPAGSSPGKTRVRAALRPRMRLQA